MFTFRIILCSGLIFGCIAKTYDDSHFHEMQELLRELREFAATPTTPTTDTPPSISMETYFRAHAISYKYDMVENIVRLYYYGFPSTADLTNEMHIDNEEIEHKIRYGLDMYAKYGYLRLIMEKMCSDVISLLMQERVKNCIVAAHDRVIINFFDNLYDHISNLNNNESLVSIFNNIMVAYNLNNTETISAELVTGVNDRFYRAVASQYLAERFTELDIFITRLARVIKDVVMEWEHTGKNLSNSEDMRTAMDLIQKRIVKDLRPRHESVFRCATKDEMIQAVRISSHHLLSDIRLMQETGKIIQAVELYLTDVLPQPPSEKLLKTLDRVFEAYCQKVFAVVESQDVRIATDEMRAPAPTVLRFLDADQKKIYKSLWQQLKDLPGDFNEIGGDHNMGLILSHIKDDLENMKQIKKYLSGMQNDSSGLREMLEKWTRSKETLLRKLGVFNK